MFEIFGNYHWLYLAIIALLFFIFDQLLALLNNKTQHRILFVLTLVNVGVHFAKALTKDYVSDNIMYFNMTLTNLCAVNTVLYPLVMLTKNKLITNFFQFMGVASGIMAMVFIYEYDGVRPLDIDLVRYFLTHFILMFVSFELVRTNFVKYNYRNSIFFGIIFLLEQGIIYYDALLCKKYGLIDYITICNQSFIFGVNQESMNFFNLLSWMIPDRFYQDGVVTPVLWQVGPAFYATIIIFLISILFVDREGFQKDIKKIKNLFINKYDRIDE